MNTWALSDKAESCDFQLRILKKRTGLGSHPSSPKPSFCRPSWSMSGVLNLLYFQHAKNARMGRFHGLRYTAGTRRCELNPDRSYRGSSRGGRLEMVGVSHETGEEKELELVGPNNV